MELVTHGGRCCGVRTIYSLGSNPDYTVDALEKPPSSIDYTNISAKGGAWEYSKQAQRFFKDTAPREPAVDRLKRYIAYTEQLRPRGMIEVYIAGVSDEQYAIMSDTTKANYDKHDQGRSWAPVLTELGFKEVNRFVNWNTNKTIFVWNRNSGEVPVIEFPVTDPGPSAKVEAAPESEILAE